MPDNSQLYYSSHFNTTQKLSTHTHVTSKSRWISISRSLWYLYTIRCPFFSYTMHTNLRQPPIDGENAEAKVSQKYFVFSLVDYGFPPLNSLQTVAMRIQFSSELVWFMGNRQSKQRSPTPMKFGTQREDFILILFSDICLRALYKFTFTKNWISKTQS